MCDTQPNENVATARNERARKKEDTCVCTNAPSPDYAAVIYRSVIEGEPVCARDAFTFTQERTPAGDARAGTTAAAAAALWAFVFSTRAILIVDGRAFYVRGPCRYTAIHTCARGARFLSFDFFDARVYSADREEVDLSVLLFRSRAARGRENGGGGERYVGAAPGKRRERLFRFYRLFVSTFASRNTRSALASVRLPDARRDFFAEGIYIERYSDPGCDI